MIFKTLLEKLRDDASNDDEIIESRRRYPRRMVDMCVAVIDGRSYPVEDWSLGGVAIQADERLFSVGQAAQVSMKFKLRSEVHIVEHQGTVVRKKDGSIAIQFAPLLLTTRKGFQKAIDDQVASEFASSQM